MHLVSIPRIGSESPAPWRVQAVRLVARGFVISEAAPITGAKPNAVYRWLHLYLRTHQLDSLRDAPRSGRPRVAERITGARILREFRRDPLRLGYNTTGWTVALLAKHLGRKSSCTIAPRALRRRMRDLGLRWKRPR